MAEHLLCKERVRSSSLLVSTSFKSAPYPLDPIDPLFRALLLRSPTSGPLAELDRKVETRRSERIAPYQLDM